VIRAFVKAWLIGGLIAGTADILAAALVYHVSPQRILQSVAVGVLGRGSFQMGLHSILTGAFWQTVISLGAALVYCGAAARLHVLLRRPLVCGLLFGAACNLFLFFVVIPLSAAKQGVIGSYGFNMNLLLNILLFGTPIAFAARRFLAGQLLRLN
jgi:hypothetical protein